MQGPNSENVVSGGFVAGHGGNTTVIKLTSTWDKKVRRFLGCWHNWFSGILNEPGKSRSPQLLVGMVCTLQVCNPMAGTLHDCSAGPGSVPFDIDRVRVYSIMPAPLFYFAAQCNVNMKIS